MKEITKKLNKTFETMTSDVDNIQLSIFEQHKFKNSMLYSESFKFNHKKIERDSESGCGDKFRFLNYWIYPFWRIRKIFGLFLFLENIRSLKDSILNC